MLGQAGHFLNFAPEKISYPIERYTREAARLYGVLDVALKGRDHLFDAFSIANIACWPWILFRAHHGISLDAYAEVARWFEAVRSRPSVDRVMTGIEVAPPPTFDADAKRILFNIGEE